MHILVITNCTKQKLPYGTKAENLYTGQSHVQLMSGVREARRLGHTVDVEILSANYGWVDGQAHVEPYNCSILQMSRSHKVAFAANARKFFRWSMESEGYDLKIVCVGRDYLRHCVDGLRHYTSETPTIFLGDKQFADTLTTNGPTRIIVFNNELAKQYGHGTNRLRGFIGKGILRSPEEGMYKSIEELLA